MTESAVTEPTEPQTAAEAIEPPAQRQPSPEQLEIHRLRQHNEALRTLLGTVLLRSNKTLVLLGKQRQSYFDLVATLGGRVPLIDVEPQGKTGNLIVKLVTDAPPPSQAGPAHPPLFELETMLQDAGIAIEYEKLEKLTPLQLSEAAQWAAAALAKGQGVLIEVPEKPQFLVDLESAPTTEEQPATIAE